MNSEQMRDLVKQRINRRAAKLNAEFEALCSCVRDFEDKDVAETRREAWLHVTDLAEFCLAAVDDLHDRASSGDEDAVRKLRQASDEALDLGRPVAPLLRRTKDGAP
jgi:hypothetical protein